MSYIRLTTKRRQTGAGGQTSPPSCCATTAFPHVLITAAAMRSQPVDVTSRRRESSHRYLSVSCVSTSVSAYLKGPDK